MGEGGFEPPKAEPTGLQPVPFGHSGTPPGTLAGYRLAPDRARGPELHSGDPRTSASHQGGVRIAPTMGRGALLAQPVEHLHGKEGLS